VIRLEGVSRSFSGGPHPVAALDGIDLEIATGEFVAVAGPSGSGKTSLLNLIGALDRPSAGRVLLDGEDLGQLPEARLDALRLERMGFVFQQFNLIPVLSAAENVELPLLFRRSLDSSDRQQRVAEALARVGLTARSAHRPAQLSGGEQQRVAVARALAGRPAVVIADEPTANLDHVSGASVIGLMREINRELGVTLLFATHDAELLSLADRVITLRDGRCVA
jgi:putative ABC transport system ATP-binding protein